MTIIISIVLSKFTLLLVIERTLEDIIVRSLNVTAIYANHTLRYKMKRKFTLW